MPDGVRAGALARLGVDVVKGDLDDGATLRRALDGAWGVFSVQNTLEAGVEREEAQGKRLATLAREPASNTSCTRPWDRRTSGRASHTSTTSGHRGNRAWPPLPSHVILRPVFFMENC